MSPHAQVAHLIGVPYLLHGSDPAVGWDCLGCARHAREVLGRPWHSDGIEYSAVDALSAERRAELITARLSDWTPLGTDLTHIRPGAVLLFKYFGALSHVAVALSSQEFIHCVGGHETSIVDFDREPQWQRRLRGAYD